MNKTVCTICGTSYPENVSECPICGFVRSSDHSRENSEHTYTHVPGGRFSKSNVRKRNQNAQVKAPNKAAKKAQKKNAKPAPEAKPVKKKEEKTSAGLVIVIILLLLAIIAVVGYIALRFFLPDNQLLPNLEQLSISSIFQKDETIPEEPEIEETPAPSETEIQTEPEPVLCQDIILDQTDFTCENIGDTYQITYQLFPEDTEEEIFFDSSDDSVATVDEFGLVTINGEGSAFITATCGSASAQFEVTCVLPTEEVVSIALNRKEITFTSEGESWLLYDGTVNVSDILWTSDDNDVATISDGKVVATGNGDTTVYGFYNGQTVTCSIHCEFADDDTTEATGNISEANGDSKTYKLYNPHGRSDDVTMKVGKEFKLRLVDEYKNDVEGVEWKVEDPDICSYKDGVVKALSAGTTKVIATYNGKTYSCIVRVNKK